jgi:predicted nucleic acid-binding protein
MIVLDTDVVSATLRPKPEPQVVEWLDRRHKAELFVTAITVVEILSGIEHMRKGARRYELEASFERALQEIFTDRILPLDERAARVAAHIYGVRRNDGIVVGPADTQIAGIAVSRGAAIATRNVRHFPGLSVPVINPWEAA